MNNVRRSLVVSMLLAPFLAGAHEGHPEYIELKPEQPVAPGAARRASGVVPHRTRAAPP